MPRILVLISIAAGMVLGAMPAHGQAGYDRPGGDYLNVRIPDADPALCAALCDQDRRCKAWSFSYPGTPRTAATCWMKNAVTPRVRNNCCVSGVRGAGVIEPADDGFEFSTDRFGGDYASFPTVRDPVGGPCAAACEADPRCRAWTYVRPGYIGAAGWCYLKERVTRPRRNPCCISGVVR